MYFSFSSRHGGRTVSCFRAHGLLDVELDVETVYIADIASGC